MSVGVLRRKRYLQTMAEDLKALWESLKAEAANPSPGSDWGERFNTVMRPVYALRIAFRKEHGDQPFTGKASCPICGSGTVTYRYLAPLVGSMRCDTPDCVGMNF